MAAPPIRVLGRIDLAEQILAALRASGVEAELYTGAPGSAGAGITRDAPGVDVVAVAGVSGLDVCEVVKGAARTRPVVAVTWPDAAKAVRQVAAWAFGPDVHAPWPATGAEIVAACTRAVEASKVRRPTFPRAWIPCMVAVAVWVASMVAAHIIDWPSPWVLGRGPGPLAAMLNALSRVALGLSFYLPGPKQLGMRLWMRILGASMVLLSGPMLVLRLLQLYWSACP